MTLGLANEVSDEKKTALWVSERRWDCVGTAKSLSKRKESECT